MRITHSKHLTAAGNTRHDIATIEMLHRGFQHILHLNVLVDVACDILIFQSLLLCLTEVTLHLTVKTVTHELEHDIAVAVDTRALTDG